MSEQNEAGQQTEQKNNQIFAVLQKIGQSLMVPVSVLPAAGLMVALGRVVKNLSEGAESVVTNPALHGIGEVLYSGGLAIFEQLAVVFAIGVAIGFTGGAGVAGLASVAGYFTLVNVLKVMGDVQGISIPINMGVFGGIAIGIITASLYKRFYQTRLHPVLGFFSGKRLVPIVTVGAAIVLGIVMGYIWPPIQGEIRAFGTWVMGSSLGPAFYAAGKRLLIPVGLHHVYYPPFLYEFGEYTLANGKVVLGESARYFAGDHTAGRFMASEFPLMLFGLPAASLAMYMRAEKSKKKAIAGVMLSAALTSIVTGITEPIEFAFIFVAPLLFGFHVVMAFLSGVLTNAFNIQLGYTFSASVIDFFLGLFNARNPALLFLVVGPIVALAYFSAFYWAIGKFDLKTPGREAEEGTGESVGLSASDRAVEILRALGDKDNIRDLDACITRLRLNVKDGSKVNIPRLKELGATGVMNAGGGNYQAIFGTQSDLIKEEIRTIIARGGAAAVAPVAKSASVTQIADSKVKVGEELAKGEFVLGAPIAGRLVPMEEVPDPTFAQKLLGDGVAIDPSEGVVYAPVDAEVAQLFRTNHAIGLVTANGLEILIHIGIDTVKMNGKGFKAFVANGDKVKAGDKLIEFDLEAVRREAKSTISPVVITNSAEVKNWKSKATGTVKARQDLLSVTL